MIIVILAAMAWTGVALAMDSCPSYKEVPGSAKGAYADYDITFPVWLANGWEAVLKGNESPGKRWVYHKIVTIDPVKYTATARIYNWESGEDMEFSTGKYDLSDLQFGDLDEIVYWSDPTVCPGLLYPKDALPEDRHYKMRLGEKYIPPMKNIVPLIAPLLLKGNKECIVIDKKLLWTRARTGEGFYELTLSLRNITGNPPADAVPMISRELTPGASWTEEYYPGQRIGNRAVFKIDSWHGGPMQFSLKLAKDGHDFWPDIAAWNNEGCSEYIYGDNINFVVKLGELPSYPPPHSCPVFDPEKLSTNGTLATYRIPLSLQALLPENVPGDAMVMVDRQSAPNATWTGFYQIQQIMDKAYLVVTDWPVGTYIEFSYKRYKDGVSYWTDWNADQWSNECKATYFLDGHFRVLLN